MLGPLQDWGGWSLVIQCTWNRKENLGFWLKISKHRSDPGPWPLDTIARPPALPPGFKALKVLASWMTSLLFLIAHL